jgi:hypothetical protein
MVKAPGLWVSQWGLSTKPGIPCNPQGGGEYGSLGYGQKARRYERRQQPHQGSQVKMAVAVQGNNKKSTGINPRTMINTNKMNEVVSLIGSYQQRNLSGKLSSFGSFGLHHSLRALYGHRRSETTSHIEFNLLHG